MIKRLDNIGIAVRDVQKAVEFYQEKLGLQGQARGSDGSVQIGDISLYVFQTDSKSEVGRTADYFHNPVGIDHLAFEVEDIEQASRELEGRGVGFQGGIVGSPGQFRYRGFNDLDGNMLYIIQRPA